MTMPGSADFSAPRNVPPHQGAAPAHFPRTSSAETWRGKEPRWSSASMGLPTDRRRRGVRRPGTGDANPQRNAPHAPGAWPGFYHILHTLGVAGDTAPPRPVWRRDDVPAPRRTGPRKRKSWKPFWGRMPFKVPLDSRVSICSPASGEVRILKSSLPEPALRASSTKPPRWLTPGEARRSAGQCTWRTWWLAADRGPHP